MGFLHVLQLTTHKCEQEIQLNRWRKILIILVFFGFDLFCGTRTVPTTIIIFKKILIHSW